MRPGTANRYGFATQQCLRLICGWLLVAACAPASVAADRWLHVFENAEFVQSAERTPPPDTAPWQPAHLPDNWYFSHPGPMATGWYRLAFDLPAGPVATYILYLPRNSAQTLIFFINGRQNAANQVYGDPGSRAWSPPIIYTLPEAMLNKPGRNVMHIRATAIPELRQGLTRVVIGDGPATRPLYENRLALQVDTIYMFGAAAFVTGLLAAAFWLRDRRDSTLLWFAVTALAWALAAFPWTAGAVAHPAFSHGPLAFVLRFAYAAPMLMVCLRVADKHWRWIEVALWLFTLTGLILVRLISDEHQGFVITAWSVSYLAALLLLLALLYSQGRQGKWTQWILATAVVLVVVLNAYDLARWLGWIDYDSLTLAHFHIPLVLFAIGATIIDRHIGLVQAVARANVELEARVAEKAREIEANYARMQEAEREKSLARERQRIMADMHDGLGSSLVGLLGTVQSGTATLPEIERRLHDALQELRLAVDAFEPVDGDLGVVLGNVRHRMRSAIEDSGVRLNWQVEDLPRLSYLTPKAILSIQRIVLEALTNALRHAHARSITVKARADGGSLQIAVEDDGVGFDASNVNRGRGLDSLRDRARGIGGALEIYSAPGKGVIVALQLPLDGPGGD